MKNYRKTYLQAAELIASGKETCCCHAICTAQNARSRERKEENLLLAEYLKPKSIKDQSSVWWYSCSREDDKNARIFALLLMAEICK